MSILGVMMGKEMLRDELWGEKKNPREMQGGQKEYWAYRKSRGGESNETLGPEHPRQALAILQLQLNYRELDGPVEDGWPRREAPGPGSHSHSQRRFWLEDGRLTGPLPCSPCYFALPTCFPGMATEPQLIYKRLVLTSSPIIPTLIGSFSLCHLGSVQHCLRLVGIPTP